MDEDDIGRLFTLPPEEFVGARDALVKRLRSQGDGEGARHVRGLRRPTPPAWAVDQLPRSHADQVDLLLEAGERLQQAQQQALSGHGGADLRKATASRRKLIDHLTDLAAGILTDAGRDPAPHRAAIAATLTAATVDAEAGEALRRGMLSKELTPSPGFGDMWAAVAPAAPAPAEDEAAAGRDRDREARAVGGDREARKRQDRVAREHDERAARRRRRQQELERARDDADRAREHARAAEHDAEDARREADAAAAELERLEQRLREARRRAETAARRRDEAITAAERARREAQLRAAEAEQAQQRADRESG